MDELFQSRAATTAALDHQRSLASPPDGPVAVLMPRVLAELLSTCTRFRTLPEHVAQFLQARRLPDEHRLPLLGALQEAARAGFLIDKGDLLRRTVAQRPPLPAAKLDAIAIITRDRPRGLERCLRSYLADMRANGRAPQITVMDSSPDPATREQNRAILRALANEAPVAVAYADPDDKSAFARELAQAAGVAEEVVRFALFDLTGVGHDTGANRNAVLLAHAGRPFLSADDDTVCDPRALAPEGGTLGLAASDPTALRLCRDLVDAYAVTQPASLGVLEGHELLLGKSVAACLEGRPSDEVVLDALPAPMLEAMLAGRARVAATFAGLLGDCGADQPSFHLFRETPLPPDQAALEDEQQFHALAASRQIVRAAPRPTIASGTFTMAGTFALDAREPCPPFFPVGRGEDLLFGNLFRRCWDDCFFGYLPWTSAHLPLPERRWEGTELWDAATRRPLHALMLLLCTLVSGTAARSGWARLRLFGRQLEELAAQPWGELEPLLRRQSWRQGELQLLRLDTLVSNAPPRSAWATRARQYRDACAVRLQATTSFLPPDFDHLAPDASRVQFARLAGAFGELLEAWPALMEAAQRLSQRERTLARAP